jgi:DNA-binding GntR family transcriptional regulator
MSSSPPPASPGDDPAADPETGSDGRRPGVLEHTAAKVVAGLLRDEIQSGTLSPGMRLRQNETARRFGVSSTPVREAFAQLEAEGLLRIDPHRGAVVFRPTIRDLIEFYEIREALESLVVRQAIPHLDEPRLEELQDLVVRMRRTEDARAWMKLNDEFHRKIYECADRPRLSSMIESLRDASTPYMRINTAGHTIDVTANEEHERILAACVAGDAEAAEAAIREHLRSATDRLVTLLSQPTDAQS